MLNCGCDELRIVRVKYAANGSLTSCFQSLSCLLPKPGVRSLFYVSLWWADCSKPSTDTHTPGDAADFYALHTSQPLCRVSEVMIIPEGRDRISGFKKA